MGCSERIPVSWLSLLVLTSPPSRLFSKVCLHFISSCSRQRAFYLNVSRYELLFILLGELTGIPKSEVQCLSSNLKIDRWLPPWISSLPIVSSWSSRYLSTLDLLIHLSSIVCFSTSLPFSILPFILFGLHSV